MRKAWKCNGWTITREVGVGKGPDFKPMEFFCVVGPHVKTETRVGEIGLRDILPEFIYNHFMDTEDKF